MVVVVVAVASVVLVASAVVASTPAMTAAKAATEAAALATETATPIVTLLLVSCSNDCAKHLFTQSGTNDPQSFQFATR